MNKLVFLAALTLSGLSAQELELTQIAGGLELSWKRAFPGNTGVASQIDSRILTSPDLRNWVEFSTSTAEDSSGDGISSVMVDGTDGTGFFRLEEHLSYQHRASLGDQPAEYGRQLANAKGELPGVSVAEFAKMGEDAACLTAISWDPTTATFWNEFNTSPEDHNATLPANDPERRLTDFRLNEQELALFKKNGFVVSERIARKAFDDGSGGFVASTNPVDYYYRVWTDDLPVFISSDSILDAWHQTFVGMLEEMEELYLYSSYREILSGIEDLSTLETAWQGSQVAGADKVRQAIDDLNVYLGTGHRLILGNGLGSPAENPDPSTIDHWVYHVSEHKETLKTDLYGDRFRYEDMTLYEPRGHYANSETLKAYFQALIWLSRAQFQIAAETSTTQHDREFRAAILLALHVRNSGVSPLWEEIEKMVQLLVGQSDAMTVKEMLTLLESLSLDSVEDLTSDLKLTTIRQALLQSTYGIQEINGGQAEAGGENCDHLTSVLPRAFSLFGQRWTPDAWAFNQVVVPSVTDEEGKTLHRRMPSGLDAMFAVVGNDAAAPILATRMENNEGVPFRDGIPFQDELLAVRTVMDAQQPGFWQEHIYGSWLHSLRALSTPLPSTTPETFRTTAWKRRILNTQLASWTQLRHDTLLYAEQSFTPPILCDFPDGYVDPYPELFQRLSEMSLRYQEAISNLEWTGSVDVQVRDEGGFGGGFLQTIDLETRQIMICDHLTNFSNTCLQLKQMAEVQLSGAGHTAEMSRFIKGMVESQGGTYGGFRTYSGWFPKLYYRSSLEFETAEHPSVVWNPVVADVHTDSIDIPCTGDPGGILHEGVGFTQFMLVAVQHPDGSSCLFGGPVMSHFEFITDRETRLTDSEWKEMLQRNSYPEPADWKLDFIVPELRAD